MPGMGHRALSRDLHGLQRRHRFSQWEWKRPPPCRPCARPIISSWRFTPDLPGVVSAGAPYAIDTALQRCDRPGVDRGAANGRRKPRRQHHGPFAGWVCLVLGDRYQCSNQYRRRCRQLQARGARGNQARRGDDQDFCDRRAWNIWAVSGLELSEELGAAIDAAHQRGAGVRAHIAHRGAILAAVRLGVDVVDHGDGLDQECIDRMLEKGTFLVPSMFYPFRVSQVASGAQIDAMKKDMYEMYKILPVANRAGLRMTLGGRSRCATTRSRQLCR